MSSTSNIGPDQPWSVPDQPSPAARRVEDRAALPTSYIDRITCPTRQDFYKRLKQELYSKIHSKLPKVIKNVQQETKKNYKQKSYYNLKQQEAIIEQTVAVLSLQLANREKVMSEMPLKSLSPKRPHIVPSYTVTPKQGMSEYGEDKGVNVNINIVDKHRSNGSGYRSKNYNARHDVVKTSQSLQSPKCKAGNLGNQSYFPGRGRERHRRRSPDYEQSTGLESDASTVYGSLSPGSSPMLTSRPKNRVTQDKTCKSKVAKKNSVLYTAKNISNSAPSKDQQRSPATHIENDDLKLKTHIDNDDLKRKGRTSKARMIIKPLVVNGANTKCHYLSSSQTLHVDIKPTVYQPVLAKQNTAPSVQNKPQPKPQQTRTLPITARKTSSTELLSANKILSPIFRKMSSNYGSVLYPRVVATKGPTMPTVYRMALPHPWRHESGPTPVYRSSTNQEMSSARLNMSRNMQPRNHSMSANFNTATDDSKRTTPSIYATKTSRLRSDAAVLRRNQLPYERLASTRMKSASVAMANARLKSEERGTGLQVRPARIKSAGEPTQQFRYLRGPLRQIPHPTSPDGTVHNTLNNTTSSGLFKAPVTPQRSRRQSDRSKKCTTCRRCVCQERGKVSTRARPSNRAFWSPRSKIEKHATSPRARTPDRPVTSPPLTSDAATWFGRKLSEETAPLTRFKSRTPRLKASSTTPPLSRLSQQDTAQSQQFLNKPSQSQRSEKVTQSQGLDRYKSFDRIKQSQQLKPIDAIMQPQRLRPSSGRFRFNVGPTMPLARLPSTERINLLYRLRSREGSSLLDSLQVRPASHSDRTRNCPIKTAKMSHDLKSDNQTTELILYPTACPYNTKPVHLVYNANPNSTPVDGNNQNNTVCCKNMTASTESHRDLLNKLSSPMALKCFKKSLAFHRSWVTTPSSRRQKYNRMTYSAKNSRLSNDNIRSLAANPTIDGRVSPETPEKESRHRTVSDECSDSQSARDFGKLKTVTLANTGQTLDTCTEYSEGYSQTHCKNNKLRK